MKKQTKKLMDYFIGDLLAKTNDTLERSKIEMLYGYCFLNIFPLFAFLPFLFQDGSIVPFIFVFITILILVASLFIFKIFKVYKPILYFLAFVSPLFVLLLVPIIMPQDLSVFMTFIYITMSLVIFTLNDRWAFTIVFATMFVIGLTAYLKSIGFQSGSILGLDMIDPSILGISSVIKIGMPMVLLSLAVANFVRINRQTNDELIANVKKKESLNQDLQTSKEQFKTLVEGAEDLVYELTPEGKFKYANPAFEQVTGYSPDYVLGMEYTFLIHPKAIDIAKRYIDKAEYAIPDNAYVEFPIITKAGKTVWVGQKVNYVNDENGNLSKYMCISRDITQQKEISQNLEKAKAEAEKAAMIKAQFLSAMSHEIRTPINAVLGTIHLMADEHPRIDQVPHLNTLKYSAENLMDLVSHILDYNKLDADQINIKNVPFKLKECLQHTKAGVDQFAKEKGIKFTIELDPTLPKSFLGDSYRISQVLSNLTHNAIKFTETGSVTVQVTEHKKTEETIHILFSVKDTGKGIPKEKLNSIFKKFTQATDETVLDGTGLGLAISSKIVALFNSRIDVKSTLGKGSTFSFILELKKANQKSSNVVPNQKGLQIKTQDRLADTLLGINILLVEDNIINQKVASSLLTRWGADFTIAENGQVAIDKIKETDYEIVLMDIQMPIMDGIKATTMIRAMGGKYATIPIVALTASAVLEVRQNALEAGLNDFLTKPFQPENLNKTILKHTRREPLGEKALTDLASIENLPGPGE